MKVGSATDSPFPALLEVTWALVFLASLPLREVMENLKSCDPKWQDFWEVIRGGVEMC